MKISKLFSVFTITNNQMNDNQIQQALRMASLFKKYLNEELSSNERHELEVWMKTHPKNHEKLIQLIQNRHDLGAEELKVDKIQHAYHRLISRINEEKEVFKPIKRSIKPAYRYIAAAIILIIFSAGLAIIFYNGNENGTNDTIVSVKRELPKGVTLTLSNGKIVDLEEKQSGLVASHENTTIIKGSGNLITYESSVGGGERKATDAMNSLSVSRGKQYQLILPDGSKVWLNAETTISFPVSFNKKERVVSLTGEAYFEVLHASNWPFRVKTAEQNVEVLGTTFNISAYPDDAKSLTTLVSGSVKVFDQTSSKLLKPGQLAIKENGGASFVVGSADLEETLAWKNGLLVFKDETIENLTIALARTFDVDFDIDPKIKGQHFGGSFSIKNGLPNLLRSLEQTGAIKFKMNGRRISVMP
ncbi:fec operon regulator FecR [compost metagenome]